MRTKCLKQLQYVIKCVFVYALLCSAPLRAQTINVTETRGNDRSMLLQDRNSITFNANTISNATITVDENLTEQRLDGFGFALTQGSAEALSQLSDATQTAVLNDFFKPNQSASISMLRISIGASDLSNSTYTYNETVGDTNMDNFSLSGPDRRYLIPILKKVLEINPNIKILATPWTAPTWMKIDRDPNESDPYIGGRLDARYYEAYARYFVKYMEAMRRQGISIWGITPQNEPENPFNQPSMRMTASEQFDFVNNHLGPDLDAAGFGAVKIIGFDHNCDNPDYPVEVARSRYVDGSAFHLYAGDISTMSEVRQRSGKDVFFTEQFTAIPESNDPEAVANQFDGDFGWHMENVVIGSLTNFSKTVLEWNLASFADGTPRTPRGCMECLGAITVDPTRNRTTKNVSYYIISQISRFVKVGATRLRTSSQGILNVAFKNPNGDTVLLVYNRNSNSEEISVNANGRSFRYTMPGRTATTFVWKDWETIANGYYRLKNVATRRYLQSFGSQVRVSTSASGNSKQWRFVKTGNFYNIDSKPRGILRARGSRDLISTLIAPPNNANDKLWTITRLTDGTYRFKNRASNKYLYNSTINGNLTATHSSSTSNRSKWNLEFVSSGKNTIKDNGIANEIPSNITIYPNPVEANGFDIDVPSNSGKLQIQILDMLGKLVYEATTNAKTYHVETTIFNNTGIYIVKLKSDTIGVHTEKLIIR